MIASYFKESQGYEYLEVPGVGFVLYRIFGSEFHVGHVYIVPEMRGKGLFVPIGEACEKIALEMGCTHLSGTVTVTPENKEVSNRLLSVYLQFGCKVEELVGNAMIFKKDLV